MRIRSRSAKEHHKTNELMSTSLNRGKRTKWIKQKKQFGLLSILLLYKSAPKYEKKDPMKPRYVIRVSI